MRRKQQYKLSNSSTFWTVSTQNSFWLLCLQPPAQLVIKLSQMNESRVKEGGGGGGRGWRVNTDVQIKCEWFILPRLVAFSGGKFPMAKERGCFHYCPADCHHKLIFSLKDKLNCIWNTTERTRKCLFLHFLPQLPFPPFSLLSPLCQFPMSLTSKWSRVFKLKLRSLVR